MDIGIVIALEEEFDIFHQEIAGIRSVSTDRETGASFYTFDWPIDSHGSYSCVACVIGDMGNAHAITATQHLIRDFNPVTIINLGIAGSLDKDIKVGDIVVGTQIDNYLAISKAVPDANGIGFEFQASGDRYPTSQDYVRLVKDFRFIHPEAFKKWRIKCREFRDVRLSGDKSQQLTDEKFIGDELSLFRGYIASGPTVGAAPAFAKWLKTHRERNLVALEMEAGGIMTVIYDEVKNRKSLIIRGISDLADDRKEALDKVGEGALRAWAMYNAVQFLWLLLEANVLTHASEPAKPIETAKKDTAIISPHAQQQPLPRQTERPTGARLIEPPSGDDQQSEAEKSWSAIENNIRAIKKLIDGAGVNKNSYARFLFLHQQGVGSAYGNWDGREFDDCIEAKLVYEHEENYYQINPDNLRNSKILPLIDKTQAMLIAHEEEWGDDPEHGHDPDELFNYSFDDPDFWWYHVDYNVK